MAKKITVQIIVNEPIERVWEVYTNPKYIIKWAFASSDWCAPHAENDLRKGGRFTARMEAKDRSEGFDFSGVYDLVTPHKKIAYTMDGKDKRKVTVDFEDVFSSTAVTVTFDAENENPIEMQRAGWQAILNNFKREAEIPAAKAGKRK